MASAAAMYVDPSQLPALSRRFKELPVIESVAMKTYTLASFLDKIAGLVMVTAGVLTTFAIIIAVGVVYNSARIGLQERAWELASLRILGFTPAEVARSPVRGIHCRDRDRNSMRSAPFTGHRRAHCAVSFQRKLSNSERD